MAIYAVGDVQGCYDALARLLEKLRFEPGRDRLWLVGDLVNRGPQSLETLRFVRGLGDSAVTVLGNHDLWLLALGAGQTGGRGHTLDTVLSAPDAPELLAWLRHRPLLHHDSELGFVLVHAGIPPCWSLAQARARATELEDVLRGDQSGAFLARMRGDTPSAWSEELAGWERLRFIGNAFTRMRYCTADGALDFTANGPPGRQPAGLHPWFELPAPERSGARIVFGHWAALGRYAGGGVYGLDSGCVWGGELSALRLDLEPACFEQVRCPGSLDRADDA